MSAKANIDLVIHCHELFSSGKAEQVLAHVSPDVVVEMFAFGHTLRGVEGFRQFMQGFVTAFPDIRITPRTHVADDTRVACEFTALGTHQGPLMTPAGPIAATGKKVSFIVSEHWEIHDGKIIALRNYQDAGSVLRQIGAA
jgi:steroid delta-isomerase-like uncharacterized protein